MAERGARAPAIALALATLLASSSCTSAVDAPAPGMAPVIVSFTATPAVIAPGGASTLDWEVLDADTVRIDPAPGQVMGNGLLVSPAIPVTYKLIATGGGGETRATLALAVSTPAAPPADPVDLRARGMSGGGVLLSWSLVGLATGYVVERRASFEVSYTVLATLGGDRMIWFDAGATANQFYTYRVRSLNEQGSSAGVLATAISPPPPPEGPTFAVVPSAVQVDRGAVHQFAASGPATWMVAEGVAGGTISGSGLYRAPAGAGTWHVIADGTASAVATVTVR